MKRPVQKWATPEPNLGSAGPCRASPSRSRHRKRPRLEPLATELPSLLAIVGEAGSPGISWLARWESRWLGPPTVCSPVLASPSPPGSSAAGVCWDARVGPVRRGAQTGQWRPWTLFTRRRKARACAEGPGRGEHLSRRWQRLRSGLFEWYEMHDIPCHHLARKLAVEDLGSTNQNEAKMERVVSTAGSVPFRWVSWWSGLPPGLAQPIGQRGWNVGRTSSPPGFVRAVVGQDCPDDPQRKRLTGMFRRSAATRRQRPQ